MDERQGIVRDLVDELHALVVRRVIDAPLEDTAAVTMRRNFDAVRRNGVVNELTYSSEYRD